MSKKCKSIVFKQTDINTVQFYKILLYRHRLIPSVIWNDVICSSLTLAVIVKALGALQLNVANLSV